MAPRWIKPNPQYCSLADLDTADRAAACIFFHTIKALLMGLHPLAVAPVYCIAGRTLRTWIHSLNAQGLDALLDKPARAVHERSQGKWTNTCAT